MDEKHLGTERLIAYRQGALPAAEREAVQEHLSFCARCTGLLRELRDFEAAAAGTGAAGPESLRQEAWESLVRRLPGRAPGARPTAGRREAPRQVARFVSGAAAALLLVAIGLTVWTLRLEQRFEERAEELAAVRNSLAETERQLAAARGQIQELQKDSTGGASERRAELEARIAELTSELERLRRAAQTPPAPDRTVVASRRIDVSVTPRFAVRGQEPQSGSLRRDGTVNPVRISPPADRFTVLLSLTGHPVYGEYRLQIMDGYGEVLWDALRPGRAFLGDAGTSVSVKGLGPGLYRLRIEGRNPSPSGWRLLDEYLLEVNKQ